MSNYFINKWLVGAKSDGLRGPGPFCELTQKVAPQEPNGYPGAAMQDTLANLLNLKPAQTHREGR